MHEAQARRIMTKALQYNSSNTHIHINIEIPLKEQ